MTNYDLDTLWDEMNDAAAEANAAGANKDAAYAAYTAEVIEAEADGHDGDDLLDITEQSSA